MIMSEQTRTYTNGEITIVWKPDACIHSRVCWTGLREVFNPTKRPWVDITAADTQKIIEQVNKCPSGALTHFMNNEQPVPATISSEGKIEIKPNGPILITTDCHIQHSDGRIEIRTGKTALCRCGASGNKPFCDGTHRNIEFKG